MKLESSVGGGKLNRELDLAEIASDIKAEDVQYEPGEYHGIILRFDEEGPAVLIYKSGSFSISGAKSIAELEKTFTTFEDELSKLIGELNYDLEFTIRNLVHTAELDGDDGAPEKINLNALAIGLGMDQIEYEPEQFPGLMYRLEGESGLYLIFGTGKIVSTGYSSVEEARTGMKNIKDKITELLGL